MKFECDTNSLVRAMGIIQAAYNTRSAVQVGNDVLLQVDEDGLRLQNTDLTTFTEIDVFELKEIVPGSALVPVERLNGLIREMESDTVTIEREKDVFSIHLTGAKDDFRIMGHDPGDFPEPPAISGDNRIVFEKAVLSDALKKVAFAASKDPNKEQLQGVSCLFQGSDSYFMASDGKRLAQYMVALDAAQNQELCGIIPASIIDTILKFMELGGEKIELSLNADVQQLVISHEKGKIICRLLQGQMPNYLDLIPKEFSTVVELPARKLLTSVRKAAVLTNKENAVITLEVAAGGMFVEVSSQDIGFGKIEVENASVSGADFKAVFTIPFVLDGVRTLIDDQITLQLHDETKMGVMSTGASFRYAFMSVKYN